MKAYACNGINEFGNERSSNVMRGSGMGDERHLPADER